MIASWHTFGHHAWVFFICFKGSAPKESEKKTLLENMFSLEFGFGRTTIVEQIIQVFLEFEAPNWEETWILQL